MKKIREFLTPIFFKFPVLISIIEILRYYTGYFVYKYNLFLNKVYIGGYLFSQQEIGRGRHHIIKKILNLLIKKNNSDVKKKEIEILEIGSYCGESALLFGDFLFNKNVSFKITCVDIWGPYPFKNLRGFYSKKFNANIINGKVFNLFKHNMKKSNFHKNIIPIKGDSNKLLKKLKKKFDLIFVDGSHSYKYVYNDIKNSIKLLNNNGFLIGDDYEQSYKQTKYLNFKKLIRNNIDSIYDKKTKENFHPGVTLAVHQLLGDIPNINGLFVQKLVNKKFINIKIKN